MSGFSSLDNQINQVSALGKSFTALWTKQFNPTAAAVANEWHSLARGGGNPAADAIFDVGTNLQEQSVFDVSAGAGCIPHGGNVGAAGDDFKVLMAAAANTAAGTTVPGTLLLIDALAFYRVTTVTTTTAQTTVRSNTFTASDSGGDLLLTYANDWSPYQKVRFTTTTTLPTGLALTTDYWLIRVSATTARVAASLADAVAGTAIAYTDGGTGTHTLTCRLPRYSDGAGVNALFMNPASTAMGAGTPVLTLGYTDSGGTAGRATPTTPSGPVGKTAASNSHILYSGATGAGKFGPMVPLQAATPPGIRSIETIRNSTSYVSGSYTVLLYATIGRIPLQVLGQDSLFDFTTAFPSYPRIYDGAALYFLWKSGVATPANSAFDGSLVFGWNS